MTALVINWINFWISPYFRRPNLCFLTSQLVKRLGWPLSTRGSSWLRASAVQDKHLLILTYGRTTFSSDCFFHFLPMAKEIIVQCQLKICSFSYSSFSNQFSFKSFEIAKQQAMTCYIDVPLKWDFFIKMRAARFAPSFLQKRGVMEWGWLQVGSSHFNEKFSL